MMVTLATFFSIDAGGGIVTNGTKPVIRSNNGSFGYYGCAADRRAGNQTNPDIGGKPPLLTLYRSIEMAPRKKADEKKRAAGSCSRAQVPSRYQRKPN